MTFFSRDQGWRFAGFIGLLGVGAVLQQQFHQGAVSVLGGGVNGQAGAISHGVARAFSKLENTMRIAMRKEGLLTRDPRSTRKR